MASSKIMSFFQPNQLEQRNIEKWILGYVSACLVGRKTYCTNSILCEDRKKVHITSLTLTYKNFDNLVQTSALFGLAILAKGYNTDWQGKTMVGSGSNRNKLHTYIKSIHISNYTGYHLHLLPWYFDVDDSLCVDFQWRSSFSCTVPLSVLLSRLPLINTIESRVLTINFDMQLLTTHNKIVRIWDAVSTVRCFSNQQYQRRLREQQSTMFSSSSPLTTSVWDSGLAKCQKKFECLS